MAGATVEIHDARCFVQVAKNVVYSYRNLWKLSQKETYKVYDIIIVMMLDMVRIIF